MDFDVDRLRGILLSGEVPVEGINEDLRVLAEAWIKPRHFLDGDLPPRMLEAKGPAGLLGGHEVRAPEVGVIIEALRSKQYQGYIKHLFHAFTEEDVFPVRLAGTGTTCSLCGKDIMFWRDWNETVKTCPGIGEFEHRNFLAYGSKTSHSCICLDCLVQLAATRSFLESLDPGILNYQKRTPGSLIP